MPIRQWRYSGGTSNSNSSLCSGIGPLFLQFSREYLGISLKSKPNFLGDKLLSMKGFLVFQAKKEGTKAAVEDERLESGTLPSSKLRLLLPEVFEFMYLYFVVFFLVLLPIPFSTGFH